MLGLALSLLSKLGPLLMGPVSQFVTGINVGQILQSIWPILSALISNIRKYWRYYLPIILTAMQLFSLWGWNKDYTALSTEKAAHQADINSYRQAQKDAQAKIDAEKKQLAAHSKELTDEADRNYKSLMSKYNASLLRYQANQSNSRESSGSQYTLSTESIDGPGASTELPKSITITMDDAQICATNTARLQTAHDWALQLDK